MNFMLKCCWIQYGLAFWNYGYKPQHNQETIKLENAAKQAYYSIYEDK